MNDIATLEAAYAEAQAQAVRAHNHYARTFERLQNAGRAIRAFGSHGINLEAVQVEYAAAKRGYEAAQAVEDLAWERLLAAQNEADQAIAARSQTSLTTGELS